MKSTLLLLLTLLVLITVSCVTTQQRLDLTSKTLGCVILLEKGLLFELLHELKSISNLF